jgi:alpha-2-macroglobulin
VLRTELDTQGVAREQVVIESLLPAGLEVENPALATSAQTPWIDTDSALPVQHQEMRDDRIVLFTGAVSGVRVHYALARAVTPGIFALPAISAEAMYDPAVRSRSGAGVLRIAEGDGPADVAEAMP